MKFRKKPCEVEAIQFTGCNFEEIYDWIYKTSKKETLIHWCSPTFPELTIPTLEGNTTAIKGDWIIRGVFGEFCSCKPKIFKLTYEKIQDPTMIRKDYKIEDLAKECKQRGEYIEQLMAALHDEFPDRYPDDCEICKGKYGGVRGNEQIVDGKVMCDMCVLTGKGGKE